MQRTICRRGYSLVMTLVLKKTGGAETARSGLNRTGLKGG